MPPSNSEREYEGLWKKIAANSDGLSILLHPAYAPRVIQAVKKEKSRANVLRKNLDMPRYGKLEIDQSKQPDGRLKVTFRLKYNGDML